MNEDHDVADRESQSEIEQIRAMLQEIREEMRVVSESSKRLSKRYLTVENAAAYSDLSTKSIRRMIQSGKLTAFRPVRGRILIDKQELDAVIRNSASQRQGGRGLRA